MKKIMNQENWRKRHMTLKEAFTYQNFLEEIITKGETYLGNTGFVTTTKELHKRKLQILKSKTKKLLLKSLMTLILVLLR